MSRQRSNKGQAILPRSLPATLKRTENALRGDSALQFVSMSQTLTCCCRLTVHKSVPAVRIHLAPPYSPYSFLCLSDSRSKSAPVRRLPAAVVSYLRNRFRDFASCKPKTLWERAAGTCQRFICNRRFGISDRLDVERPRISNGSPAVEAVRRNAAVGVERSRKESLDGSDQRAPSSRRVHTQFACC
jgi:hypothetical protein